jgi:membrane-associated phospholipid phosphatase
VGGGVGGGIGAGARTGGRRAPSLDRGEPPHRAACGTGVALGAAPNPSPEMPIRLPVLRPRITPAGALRSGPRRAPARAAAALGTGALTASAFAAVAVASARRATVAADTRIHDEMRDALDGPAGDAAEAVAPAVDQAAHWKVYAPTALAAAVGVIVAPSRSREGPHGPRGRRAGAAAIAAVPAIASALSPAFDRWLPQPPVGPRRRPVDHPVFPSGHAFRATAVALTVAYVVTREAVVPARFAWLLAGVAPAGVGLSRLVREKHLASDVVGGWLAGVTLAAVAAGAYELARAPGGRPALRGRRR